MNKLPDKRLVSDFDGTMTKHDFFRLALFDGYFLG